MQFGSQAVEVIERAEERVHVGVVGDVVAEVFHRRRVDRREPDSVNAKPGQVFQPPQNTGQIAAAVAVRVLERERINLINDALLPPGKATSRLIRSRLACITSNCHSFWTLYGLSFDKGNSTIPHSNNHG